MIRLFDVCLLLSVLVNGNVNAHVGILVSFHILLVFCTYGVVLKECLHDNLLFCLFFNCSNVFQALFRVVSSRNIRGKPLVIMLWLNLMRR